MNESQPELPAELLLLREAVTEMLRARRSGADEGEQFWAGFRQLLDQVQGYLRDLESREPAAGGCSLGCDLGGVESPLYEHAPVPLLGVDAAGRILRANGQAATLLGLPEPSLKGRDFADFLVPEDRRKLSDHLSAPAQGQACDIRLRRIGGERRPVRLLRAPLDAGSEAGWVSLVLLEPPRLSGTGNWMQSADRSLLVQAIRWLQRDLADLGRASDPPSKTGGDAKAARDAADSLEDLVLLMRLESGEAAGAPVPFPLQAVLQESLTHLRSLAAETERELICEIPDFSLNLVGEGLLLERILANLVLAALEQTGPHSISATFSAEPRGRDEVEFLVVVRGPLDSPRPSTEIIILPDASRLPLGAGRADAGANLAQAGLNPRLSIASLFIHALGGRFAVELQSGWEDWFTFSARIPFGVAHW